MTDETRLLVRLENFDSTTLSDAMEAGVNALVSLPETPVAAAGVNIDFSSAGSDSEPTPLLDSAIDANISELGHTICARTTNRSLEYKGGRLNLAISSEDDELKVDCNFTRTSSDRKELEEWLEIPADDMLETAKAVIASMGLVIKETEDDAHE